MLLLINNLSPYVLFQIQIQKHRMLLLIANNADIVSTSSIIQKHRMLLLIYLCLREK